VTTETIQHGWDGVLQALMARRKVAWMVVRTASVISFQENSLTLQFPKPGDVKGFMSSGYEGLLKEVLHERFGINTMIKAVAGGGSPAGPGPGPQRGAPQPSSPPSSSPPSSVQPPAPSAMQSTAVQPVPAAQPPVPQAAALGPAVPSGPAPAASPAAAPGQKPSRPTAVPGPAAPVTSNYGSYDDDAPFPSDDDDPYALDGDEIAGSVDADFGLTGISLIQRDLGAQIIAEYEE
jgi:DNA polymerase III subunit gamma/tau